MIVVGSSDGISLVASFVSESESEMRDWMYCDKPMVIGGGPGGADGISLYSCKYLMVSVVMRITFSSSIASWN